MWVYHAVSQQSPADGHLGCSQPLDVIFKNNFMSKLLIQVTARCIPRSEIAETKGVHICDLDKYGYFTPHGGCNLLSQTGI